MRFLKLFLFIVLITAASIPTFSSHIVGGYIRYDFLSFSGNTSAYEVTITLYRDVVRANQAAIFTPTIPLTIFTQGTSRVVNIPLATQPKLIADSIEDPCFVRIDSLELEEGIYRGVINLSSFDDHLLVYQRCCRNNSIDNLVRPTELWGNTWTIEVPSFNSIGRNSSPEFRENPPIAFCPNQPLNIDLSATDIDGDSLAYEFCAPYTSPPNNPEPNPASPPPYSFIGFQSPESATDPVPSLPALSINETTGILTGTPTAIGQYVIGYCVKEYRNGLLLSTTTRDIQINTANCSPVILTAVQNQTLLCDGRTVNFTNNTPNVAGYNIKGFKWDFGDPTTLADTSRERNPSYRYPDTGLYTITLTANPGLRCSSVTTNQFLVYDSLNPVIEFDGLLCEDSNSVIFTVGGEYADYATFSWDFGFNASNRLSNADTVRDIQFGGSQTSYTVILVVQQDVCTESRTATINLSPNPVADFDLDLDEICPPFPVNFVNRSTNAAQATYIWSFGDGDSAFTEDATHNYQLAGDYEVRLTLQKGEGCKDTITVSDSVFASRSFSTNTINFGVEPKEGCRPLQVSFIDSSNYIGSARYFWDLDNNILSTDITPSFTFQDSGYYDINLLLITADSCEDTLQLAVDSAIRVLPYPTASLSISKDTSTLKEALIDFDATQSENYQRGELWIGGKRIGRNELETYRFRDTGLHVVSWIVENEFDCRDTISSEIYIFDEFEFMVPNVFTPNGDGVNDDFRVKACGVYEFKISIFNRYGKLVYNSNSLLEGWDGRINEYKASPGIYFYQIVIKDLNGDYKNYEGSLSLLYD